MLDKQNETPCKARTKAGTACRAAAMEGGLCFFHANPSKASQLGRIGGRKNRHIPTEGADSLPTLDNALGVRNMVARLIDDVYSRRLNPRVAAGLAPLLSLQLRAIETTDVQRRLDALEKRPSEGHVQESADRDENDTIANFGTVTSNGRSESEQKTA